MYARKPAILMIAAAMAAALLSVDARAQDEAEPGVDGRYEIWMGPVGWPALGDLQPDAGRFDSGGLGLGFAFHLPVRSFDDSDLLLGVDLSVAGADSNMDGFFSTVMAGYLYLGVSAKWLFGQDRNLSLDAGFGYHGADISEVGTAYWGGSDYELWSKSRAGTWVGVGWDVGRGRPGRNGGLFIAAKVHFVDFGDVYDEHRRFGDVLGSSAGRLDGPIYVLAIGYSGR